MPLFSRRRAVLSLGFGAAVALTALAMPTAASAAEICTPTTTPTTETLAWQTFSNESNAWVDVEAAYEGMLGPIAAAYATVDADFTQVEYDAMYLTVTTAFGAAGASANAGLQEFGVQTTTLETDLFAADPANQATNQTRLDGFELVLENSQFGTSIQPIFTAYLGEMGGYATAVQAAITAATPVPTVPASFTTASNALAAAINGIADYVQVNVYDASAQYVVFTQSCTPALAATGSTTDVAPVVAFGTLMLLAGATLVVARRRTV